MSKITTSIFISLDGFAASTDRDISWFQVNQEYFDYAGLLTSQADTAIYGRETFAMMEGYWPTAGELPDADTHEIEHSKWYNNSRKIVFSKTLPQMNQENVVILGENSVQKMAELKQNSTNNMVIFGSPSIVSLLTEAGLVDEYYIFISPTILGSGIPLFHGISKVSKLKLLDSKQLATGVVALHYESLR
jgi:dihydrofolate reductase